MNIVIENLNANIIDSLNISAIKNLKGVYDINTLFNEISPLEYQKVILDITSVQNYTTIQVLKSLISFVNPDNLIIVLSKENVDVTYLKEIIDIGIYNFAYTKEHIKELYQSPNRYEDALVLVNGAVNRRKIIGIKNITKHAGATTLVYILKKHLEKRCKVIGIELNKLDFNFFYDKGLLSTQENSLELIINQNTNQDVILIDINNSEKAINYCDEVLYLVEPTTIRINQQLLVDPTIFNKLKDEKVILNMCSLDNADVKEFASESHLKIYYCLPLINERKINDSINGLIEKLKL